MKANQALLITGRADGGHDVTWHEDGKIWTSQDLDMWQVQHVASYAIYSDRRSDAVDWTLVAIGSALSPERRAAGFRLPEEVPDVAKTG